MNDLIWLSAKSRTRYVRFTDDLADQAIKNLTDVNKSCNFLAPMKPV